MKSNRTTLMEVGDHRLEYHDLLSLFEFLDNGALSALGPQGPARARKGTAS